MSHTNGLLAAEALQLKPCSRVEGFGKTLILSECKSVNVNIRAVETKCGFQPFFRYNNDNYTVGKDGWSIHPFHDCFWTGQFVNINGKAYSWRHHDKMGKAETITNSDWEEQSQGVHLKNLNLVVKYTEIVLNDYDFRLKQHPAHHKIELEQGNLLAELVGRVHDTNTRSIGGLVLSEATAKQLPNIFNWNHFLNIAVIIVSSIIFLVITTCLCFLCQPIQYCLKMTRSLANITSRKSA